ncbi:MAG: hypothetical protein AB7O86_12260 [Porticoccaceae bacterium]
MKIINDVGLEEIRLFLVERHCKGDYYRLPVPVVRSLLEAWAWDAEYQMGLGNPPEIEIRASDSVSGHVETFRISDAGVSTIEGE